MNGTALCPYCNTRFGIAEAEFEAYRGMVRCVQCRKAFDAKPGYIADQPVDTSSARGTLHPDDDCITQPDGHGMDAASDNGLQQAPFTENSNWNDAPVNHPQSCPEPTERDSFSDEISGKFTAISGCSPIDSDLADTANVPDLMMESAIPVGASSKLAASDALSSIPSLIRKREVRNEGNVDRDAGVNDPLHDFHVMNLDGATLQYDGEGKRPLTSNYLRWRWEIIALLTLLMLLAQIGYFFRSDLAVRMPGLKPAISGICLLSGCSVPLPHKADLMSIESSDIEADPSLENHIIFSALLRNRASYPQVFPNLELTLNDTQDNPLARRIFRPKEYLPPAESEQAGLLPNHELSVKLFLDTADIKPYGYRLVLFYDRE